QRGEDRQCGRGRHDVQHQLLRKKEAVQVERLERERGEDDGHRANGERDCRNPDAAGNGGSTQPLGRPVSGSAATSRNVGARRAVDACSYAYASRSSVGSVYARPMNDNPTGSPKAYPAGTVMLG